VNSKTLKVRNETYSILARLKEEKGFQTFDDVIAFLIKEHEKLQSLVSFYKVSVALDHLTEALVLLRDPQVKDMLRKYSLITEMGV